MGGEGKSVYRVSNLNDSGSGSLRDAVSQGNRCVTFAVSGTINLSETRLLDGANITIDGLSALSSGITLARRGLYLGGDHVHDVIVRGPRIRIGPTRDDCCDGIGIENDAHHIIIDHNSISGATDENIGTYQTHDVTLSWNIFSDPTSFQDSRNVIVANGVQRYSLHHNLFIWGDDRLPRVGYSQSGEISPDVTLDMRNNIVYQEFGGTGTAIVECPKGNVINNNYDGDPDADMNASLKISDGALIHTSGNFSPQSSSAQLNSQGNQASPFVVRPWRW